MTTMMMMTINRCCRQSCNKIPNTTQSSKYALTSTTKTTKCMPTNRKTLSYTGQCRVNEVILTSAIRETYKIVYASTFLVCLVVVFLLYLAIYRSVYVRRRKRLRACRERNSRLKGDDSTVDATHNTVVAARQSYDAHTSDTTVETMEINDVTTGKQQPQVLDSDPTLTQKYMLANIRTAAMLFAVTVVFTFAFLPSWLMAHGVIRYHALVFYCYFSYNVLNPVIYAFMNPNVRKELYKVVCCYRAPKHVVGIINSDYQQPRR